MLTINRRATPAQRLEVEESRNLGLEVESLLGTCSVCGHNQEAKIMPPDEIVTNQWEIYVRHSHIASYGKSFAEALLMLRKALNGEAK